ncbi:MAG: YceH family protein [Chthoniobacteraceae bacterium]
MPFELNAVETRVLGCLLEKERLTPENYPLSLNAVAMASNQSTNRDPVTAYDESTVQAGLDGLREKKLVTMVSGAGMRVVKYRHRLPEHYDLPPPESALLCVLLLRGEQTPGELRQRCERMYPFATIEDVQNSLDALASDDRGLVSMMPARPGQKERRYVQRLSSASVLAEPAGDSMEPAIPALPLAERVAALEAEMQRLRAELETFRKQFE